MVLAERLLPERDCQSCQPQNKLQWGCEQDVAFAQITFDGEPALRCPLRPKFENPQWFSAAYEAYSWREKGYLPNPGTWKDQSLKFIQLCNLLDAAIAEADDEHRAVSERKQEQLKRIERARGGVQQTRPPRRR